MNQSADVVIIGAGVMGCAAAWHLAKAGQSVILLEQHVIGHALGSSHGPTRIARLAYDGLDYVELARASCAKWLALQEETGESLVLKNGGMDIGSPGAMYVEGIQKTLLAAGVPFEQLTCSEICYRYPQFHLPDNTIGFYHADWSMLSAGLCVSTLAAQAEKYGARLLERETAIGLVPTSSGVQIRTQHALYTAKKVIVAAGSWIAPLLKTIGIDLPATVLKEQVSFFAARQPDEFQPVTLPLVIHHFPATTSVASIFPIHNHRGVKLMIDRVSLAVAPDDPDRSIDAGRETWLREYAARMLPGLTQEIIESVSCRYTMTPDEDFIIDKFGDHHNVMVASPCSSHGFKFGMVIGEILADLATAGTTQWPIQRFRFDRPGLKNHTWRNMGSVPTFA